MGPHSSPIVYLRGAAQGGLGSPQAPSLPALTRNRLALWMWIQTSFCSSCAPMPSISSTGKLMLPLSHADARPLLCTGYEGRGEVTLSWEPPEHPQPQVLSRVLAPALAALCKEENWAGERRAQGREVWSSSVGSAVELPWDPLRCEGKWPRHILCQEVMGRG